MRIVFIWDAHKKTGVRNQYGFMIRLSEHCEFYTYGLGEYNANSKLAPIDFDNSIRATDLERIFKPDIFLFFMHERARRARIKGFNKVKTPKVLVESNYWTEKDLEWFTKDPGFDFIIFKTPTYPKFDMPTAWLPYSANEREFKFVDDKKRGNHIVYVGSPKKAEIYTIRASARQILSKERLLDDIGYKLNEEYIETLQSYTCGLTCSLYNVRSPTAKLFEMMLSGTICLTSPFYRSDELFGNKQCYIEYKEDMSDIVDVAKDILANREKRLEIARNAYEIASVLHTHKRRVRELYLMLRDFYYYG